MSSSPSNRVTSSVVTGVLAAMLGCAAVATAPNAGARANADSTAARAAAAHAAAAHPAAAKTITVTPTLDTRHAVRAAIDPLDGGTLQTTDSRGVHYTLTIPSQTLLSPADVTLTPIASTKGLPHGAVSVAGAVVGPAGLLPAGDIGYGGSVLLRVRLPKAPHASTVAAQQPLTYSGHGQHVEGTPVLADSTDDTDTQSDADTTRRTDEVFVVNRFGGFLLANKIVKPVAGGTGTAKAQDGYDNTASALLQKAHARKVGGHTDRTSLSAVVTTEQRSCRQVAAPRLAAVTTAANPSQAAILQAAATGLAAVRGQRLAGATNAQVTPCVTRVRKAVGKLFSTIIDRRTTGGHACTGTPLNYAREVRLLATYQLALYSGLRPSLASVQKCLAQHFAISMTGSSTVQGKNGNDIQLSQGDDECQTSWTTSLTVTGSTDTFELDDLTFSGRGAGRTTALSSTPGPGCGTWTWNGEDPGDGEHNAQLSVFPDLSNLSPKTPRVMVAVHDNDTEDFTVCTEAGCGPGFGFGWAAHGPVDHYVFVALDGTPRSASGAGDFGGQYTIPYSAYSYSATGPHHA